MQFPPNHTAGQCHSWELHTHVSDSRVQNIIHHREPSQLAGASPMSILGGAEATDRYYLFEIEFIFIFVNVIDSASEIFCLYLMRVH